MSGGAAQTPQPPEIDQVKEGKVGRANPKCNIYACTRIRSLIPAVRNSFDGVRETGTQANYRT